MISGMLNVYKEKGFTSHDVVAKLRGILHQKKIGHTGTLDPDAVGVLPVCLGSGTKLCDMLTDKDKTYVAKMKLGVVTDTQDISGRIISIKEVNTTVHELEKAIMSFVGEYSQVPPMYSAIKMNGKRLYELAREGKEIERPARKVTINEINIINIALPFAEFEVSCSKGTYIRTLCQDIGEKSGCGACMQELTRTRVSGFKIEEALKLSDIEKLAQQNRISEIVVPVDRMFSDLEKAVIFPEFEKRLLNGNPLERDAFVQEVTGSRIRVYDSEDKFTGVYGFDEKRNYYAPEKMFLS